MNNPEVFIKLIFEYTGVIEMKIVFMSDMTYVGFPEDIPTYPICSNDQSSTFFVECTYQNFQSNVECDSVSELEEQSSELCETMQFVPPGSTRGLSSRVILTHAVIDSFLVENIPVCSGSSEEDGSEDGSDINFTVKDLNCEVFVKDVIDELRSII